MFQFNWDHILKNHILSLMRCFLVLSTICFLLLTTDGISILNLGVVLSYVVFQILLFIWVKKSQGQVYLIVMTHILDLIWFSCLLHLYGGAANGAISILYIPVIAASILLNKRSAWLICILAIACYSLLMMQLQPHAHHSMMTEHIQAMWLTFVLSSLAMTWFMSEQTSQLRLQQTEITELKEQQMRDEQILAVATYAANTAHQLSTPLMSVGMLADELAGMDMDESVETIHTELIEQVAVCQSIVKRIAQQAKLDQPVLLNADEFINKIIPLWWNRRNEIELQFKLDKKLQNFQIISELNLVMAISNLLDNAADASLANKQNQVQISAELLTCSDMSAELVISIQDFGCGFDMAQMAKLGLKSFSDKIHGMGIGLILANAAIDRSKGEILLLNNNHGALTQITLPLRNA